MERSEKRSIHRPVIPGFLLPGSFKSVTLERVAVNTVQLVVEIRLTTYLNSADVGFPLPNCIVMDKRLYSKSNFFICKMEIISIA